MKRILPIVCISLAILIAVVGMITVSFSWFAPESKTGNSLMFKNADPVRSQDCLIKNHIGDINTETNVVTYNSFEAKKTLSQGVNYFRTVITNDAEYDTNVSLYLESIDVVGAADYMLAVTVPTNTCRTFKTSQSDLHIVRNAYISAYNVEKIGTGEIVVDWFVKVNSGTITIDPEDIYITYN